MHDFHEADRISQIIKQKIKENKLKKLTNVEIELGNIIEHGEEIRAENLEFNLKLLLQDYLTETTKFTIKKVKASSWKLVSIEGE